jgi:hypothetical protein
VLIARDFVFLHVPKTGGTFVQRTVADFLPKVDVGTYTHTRYDEFPASARNLPGFYVIRNPWDWYVSWYHFTLQRGSQIANRLVSAPARKSVIWHDLMDCGGASFGKAVALACRSQFDMERAFPDFDGAGLDLYTAYVKSIVGSALDRGDFTALRYERLRPQLRTYLRDRAGVDKELLRALRQDPRMRTSDHDNFAEYYDAPTRRLVGESTAWLCERFGYRVVRRGGAKSKAAKRQQRTARLAP